ncbi:MAG TPA: hypothetical protein VHD15_15450 [Hyphomicrobiales bacterium]|nr:hypothetical protein [Hyphomicrobiales bacterium]
MRMIHGLLLGGALALAAGAVQAEASPLANTVPQSAYSSLQVETPYGLEGYNPDGYQLRVNEYEQAPAAFRGGIAVHPLRSGSAGWLNQVD